MLDVVGYVNIMERGGEKTDKLKYTLWKTFFCKI